MIQIFDIPTAQKTILVRKPFDLMNFPPQVLEGTARIFGSGVTPPEAVRQILTSIQKDGDAALNHWAFILDRSAPETLQIPAETLKEAYETLSPQLKEVLVTAANRIRRFHAHQPIPGWEIETPEGRLGQRTTPVDRAGVYVPGGTAPLPSSLLMSVIPAQVAGVKDIIVCTPPNPHETILAAAYLCGVTQVYQVGGAAAIGAMAFGTESIPKVDKIVGAGSLWVTLAKQQVYGVVGLDGLAGPTETMVIADHTANPAWVAADLLAQAEHDVLASAILLTNSLELAEAVQVEIGRQMETLSRANIIAQALEGQSGIVLVPDLKTAANLANSYAAEHLCLAVEDPEGILPELRHAGGIFIGEYSFEVLGDYIAGPSHVMPTGGTARFASPLNVLDFVKITSIIALNEESGKSLSMAAADFARAESLTAHAAAADFRAGSAQSSTK